MKQLGYASPTLGFTTVFEDGQEDIHMGFLHGSLRIAAFTMHAEWDEHSFSGGGDFV